jgi:molybdenum cofactor cytidylyltransferase
MSGAIWGVLLAAGQGRRFGTNKLLHPLPDGTPLALAAGRRLVAVLPRTVAVVEDAGAELAGLLAQAGLQLVVNPGGGSGLGSSLARGVRACPEAKGWIIALADMPRVPEGVIRDLASGLEAGADIIAPRYRGQRGHPVGFARRHGAALQTLQGDAGARELIARHADALTWIDVDDPGVVQDIDRPEDLAPLVRG